MKYGKIHKMFGSQECCLKHNRSCLMNMLFFDQILGKESVFKQNIGISYHAQWRTQGSLGVRTPPRTGKNCCIKMILFPKALFVVTTFPKIDKNFLLNFHQKNFKLFSKLPNKLCFSSKRAKI